MMRFAGVIAAVILVCAGTPVVAAPIFLSGNFSAPVIFPGGIIPPFDGDVSGDFQLRFDTDHNYFSSTAAVLSASISVPVSSPFAISYDATSHLLKIGASVAGPGSVVTGTDGAFLQFTLDGASPADGIVVFTTEAYTEGAYFGGAQVSFSTVPAPVPEPAMWLTMMGGLTLTGVALRKKQRLALGYTLTHPARGWVRRLPPPLRRKRFAGSKWAHQHV